MRNGRIQGFLAATLTAIVMLFGRAVGAVEPQGMIAFTANLDGNWDLFVWQDAKLTRLTKTPLDERMPTISPDLGMVAYSMSDGTIRIMDLATGETKTLSIEADRVSHPSWSPDGRSLLFTRYVFEDGREDGDIWSYDLSSEAAKPVLIQTGVQEHPVTSPKGDRIVYTSTYTATLQGEGFGVLQALWSASLLGEGINELLVAEAQDVEPDFSPDGAALAFSSNRAVTRNLWLLKLTTGELAQLTQDPGVEMHPSFSPDGQALVFVRQKGGRLALHILKLRNGEVTQFDPFRDGEFDIRDPDWR